jgi:hypothetical protein
MAFALGGTPAAMAQPAPAPPAIGPAITVAAVPNGDLSSGLDGWGSVGPTMVLGSGPIIEAADNTTVLTAPVAIPVSAQVLPLVLGVPGANAVVDVRARPVEGGPDIHLATIVPERAVRQWQVGVSSVRGRTVRIVIDPVTSLGRRLYVRSVGPVQQVLPGWDVGRGNPVVGAVWGRRAIVADDEPLGVQAPEVDVPAGTRFLGVAVRGSGTVRAAVGRKASRLRATPDRWTTVRIPVRRGSAARLVVTAIPGEGERIAIADVGAAVRQVRVTGLSVSGSTVRATVGPSASGMRAEVRIGGGVAGRGTVDAGGRLVVRARGTGTARLVVLDDGSRIGTSVPVVLRG